MSCPDPASHAPKELHSRVLVSRLQDLRQLILAGHCPNCVLLAEKLGVTVRTVLRDIRFLRDRGEPLHYDAERAGYRYAPEKADGRGYRALDDLQILAFREPQRSDTARIQEVLPESATLQQVVYFTLERVREWGSSLRPDRSHLGTHQFGMLFKSCLIFDYLIGRSVTVLLSNSASETSGVRIDAPQDSVVLGEQVDVLEQLSRELTPRIRTRLPEFLGLDPLLGAQDLGLIRDLCRLRMDVISHHGSLHYLISRPALLAELLAGLRRLCESRFIACIVALEPRLDVFADAACPAA